MHQQRKPSNLTFKSNDKHGGDVRGNNIPHQIEPLLLRSSVTLLLGTSAGEERTFYRRSELPRKPDFIYQYQT